MAIESERIDSQRQIKFATANLSNFIEPPNAFYVPENVYTQQQWQQKCSWLSDYITRHQPDVIGFQEVFSSDVLKYLLERLGYHFFAVLDEPEFVASGAYKSPVVCLASRYPILSTNLLIADPNLSYDLGLSSRFAFSRSPLLVTLELPVLGATDVYVVHFKSKRPMMDGFEPSTIFYEHVQQQLAGACAATLQRTAEMCQLMHALIARRDKLHQPALVMGDFNQYLDADSLKMFQSDQLHLMQEPPQAGNLTRYQLYDCWDLYVKQLQTVIPERAATHYYRGKGAILDYILLSNEFDPHQSKVQINQYHCEIQHINQLDKESELTSTDHAIVSITLSLHQSS